MTDKDIVIAIFESLGGTTITTQHGTAFFIDGKAQKFEDVPDYLNDLNAMHDAEMTLIFSQRERYKKKLQEVMTKDLKGLPEGQYISQSELYRATARHRAIAFYELLSDKENFDLTSL